MADITSSIIFSQTPNVGVAGMAQGVSPAPWAGVTGTPVVVSNGNNANVVSWTYTAVGVPPASALLTGVRQQGVTPTWGFTPDVPGGYQVQLDVYDSLGNVATSQLQFGIAESNGLYIPSFQGSPASCNFGGQPFGWAPYLDAWLKQIESGSGGIDFSPVTFMEEVSAGTDPNDVLQLGSGNDTVGTGFIIYDRVKTHTCTGVRFYWPGGAGKNVPIKCSLWIYGQTGSSTVALAATITINVTVVPGEYTATFASPVTLLPGTAYTVSVYDTTGTNYPLIGSVASTSSEVARSLNCNTLIANEFLIYACPNNGGGFQGPWSLFHSGDAGPQNIGVNFFPVEPVLT